MMCCYYPTTTVAIDDDSDFLKILTQHMDITNCVSYSQPEEAIKILQNQKPFSRLLKRIINTTNISEHSDTTPGDQAIHINIRSLHEEIFNKDRFKDVSVIIVDYYMNGMNGIDVCETLKDHPAKKILLTGGADKEKIAIDAFNAGIIHRFLSKTDSNFPSRLKQAVSTLKDSYFLDISSKLLPYVNTIPRNLHQHPQYINFMHNIQDQFDAVEHYMVDIAGTSIMINSHGDQTWLIIKHDSDLEAFEKIARDHEADDYFINGLASRSLIPFFFSDEDYQRPTSEWEKYFHPTQPLPGINGYYYAICRNEYIEQDKIASYKPSR